MQLANSLTTKQPRAKKFVLGFAGLAVAGVIGTAGFANANPSVAPATNGITYGGNVSVNVDGGSGSNNVIHTVVNVVYNIFR